MKIFKLDYHHDSYRHGQEIDTTSYVTGVDTTSDVELVFNHLMNGPKSHINAIAEVTTAPNDVPVLNLTNAVRIIKKSVKMRN